jgi:hypothetical protein
MKKFNSVLRKAAFLKILFATVNRQKIKRSNQLETTEIQFFSNQKVSGFTAIIVATNLSKCAKLKEWRI